MPIRVHTLAKELKASTIKLKAYLHDSGQIVKSHMSYIEDDVADTVRNHFYDHQERPVKKAKKEPLHPAIEDSEERIGQLLCCYMCGSDNVGWDIGDIDIISNKRSYYIECKHCGATSDSHATKEQAAKEWNKKHGEHR